MSSHFYQDSRTTTVIDGTWSTLGAIKQDNYSLLVFCFVFSTAKQLFPQEIYEMHVSDQEAKEVYCFGEKTE